MKRFSKEAKAREADIIIFAVGINDSQYIRTKDNPRVELGKFERNISKLAEEAKRFSEKIVFVGLTKADESKTMPIPWRTNKYYDNESAQRYNISLNKFCAKEKIDFINMLGLLDDSDLEDGLHPNSNGHVKMFEKIKEAIECLIV